MDLIVTKDMKIQSKKNRLLFLLSLLVVVGTCYLFFRNDFSKNDIYIFFDVEKHIIDGKIKSLNKIQTNKTDSIKNKIYKYPYKTIILQQDKYFFSIIVNPNVEVKLKIISKKKIDRSFLNSLNILTVNSFLQKIPFSEYLGITNDDNIKSFKDIRFNVIFFDKKNYHIIEVNPVLIEND